MKILVMEYITGGGLAGAELPPGLVREGGLMRRALLDDLLQAGGVSEVLVLNDARIPAVPADTRVQWLPVSDAAGFSARWREGLGACDALWLVAPESGGILADLSAEAEAAGIRLLSNPSQAVNLAGSKSATLERLRAHGLPVVESWHWADYRVQVQRDGLLANSPLVIKPDDGVGCEHTRIFFHPDEPEVPDDTAFIVQPLLEGEPLSLSILFAAGEASLLTVNRQMIDQRDKGFVLTGCLVNALSDTDGRWQKLAEDVARAMPELWGYAGIDLILTAQGPRILEINPRLTTSYAGIRRAIGHNPAEFVLELMRGGALPPPVSARGIAVAISLRENHAD
ncbi:ATP-grasp domain-containing protein [Methylococcus sp. EFPC2]|uniref:ATP-grasp domain-containing protein n=1 Tax=Methylococcus sp. EFPC2 TaxID=2812648 RepID=UPI0019682463|nr:ATP-grasp domain-containing protein [Methylococcus sp. EFPC2]QSA96737.1 ATP-grasp domain-containing protein [Methylococcus sp. EFPC2]